MIHDTSFEETVLKTKVAQICNSVGYHAISQDSSNILVDIYRKTIHHLARHCKDAANNNRRVESTLIDLVQAYEFVGISIPELVDHIANTKLSLVANFDTEEREPSNRIKINLLVDDSSEAQKNSQDDGENKASSDNGEEEEKPVIPLMKDAYEEITKKFTDCKPVTADKNIRLGGRIVLVGKSHTELKIAPPVLKITAPVLPELAPSTSKNQGKDGKKKKKREIKKKKTTLVNAPPPVEKAGKKGRGKKKKRLSKEEQRPPSRTQRNLLTDDPLEPQKKSHFDNQDHEEIKVSINNSEEQERPPVPESDDTFDEIAGKFTDSNPVTSDEHIRLGSRIVLGNPSESSITPPILKITPPVPELVPSTSKKESKDGKKKKKKEIKKTKTNLVSAQIPVEETGKKSKGKKKKKSKDQFEIVSETVSAENAEKEWFCPACGGPDDGDVMVQCDSCQEWYHLGCTDLKKAPEDDENWACDPCASKAKAAQKKPPVQAVKTKTPEPVAIHIPTPPPPVVASSSSQDVGDRCPECNLPDDGTMMIQCDDPFCAKWFHGKCVNLLEEPKEDESWFCKVCVDKQQSAFKRRRRAK